MLVAPDRLEEGVAALVRRDPMFAEIVRVAGVPRFRRRPPGFPTLLYIILEQQVSTAAAAAMFGRLQAAAPALAPETFQGLDDAALRSCGFSRQKMRYARDLAEAIRAGRFDPGRLHSLDDDAAMAELTRLNGFGRWSAEVYLLFALGRPDIWPAEDLGLRVAVQERTRRAARPTGAELRALAEPWRPWRSAAACLLWQSYLHARRRDAPGGAERPAPPNV
jgi:DNA-3-methyladenine glycosylase II